MQVTTNVDSLIVWHLEGLCTEYCTYLLLFAIFQVKGEERPNKQGNFRSPWPDSGLCFSCLLSISYSDSLQTIPVTFFLLNYYCTILFNLLGNLPKNLKIWENIKCSVKKDMCDIWLVNWMKWYSTFSVPSWFLWDCKGSRVSTMTQA